MFALRLSGCARVSHCNGERTDEYLSQRGSLTCYPQGAATEVRFDGGPLEDITFSIGVGSPLNAALASLCGAYVVGRPDLLALTLAIELAAALAAPATSELRSSHFIDALVETLLRRVVRRRLEQQRCLRGAAAPGAALRAVIANIPNRCGETLSIAVLAAEAGLRPTQFSQRFKDLTGLSPHQYLLRVRLERVCHALQRSDARIADIALDLGFSSQSHLTAVFHKMLGVTPIQFRQGRVELGQI